MVSNKEGMYFIMLCMQRKPTLLLCSSRHSCFSQQISGRLSSSGRPCTTCLCFPCHTPYDTSFPRLVTSYCAAHDKKKKAVLQKCSTYKSKQYLKKVYFHNNNLLNNQLLLDLIVTHLELKASSFKACDFYVRHG